MNNMGAEGGGYCSNGNGGGSAVLQVKVIGKDRVAAVLPLQEHWLPLSNLDLLLPHLDVGVFFCYKNDNDYDFVTVTAALKASLAQTLVTYYPFAGEVVTNSTGEPELLCNNRGVDFITAYADVDLRDLNLHNPDDTVDNKLIPNKMIKGEEDDHGSVLCIQATALKCGGMVLACTFDHRISDAYSANMFLVAWAEIALNNVIAAANSSSSSSEERRKKPPAAAAVAPTFRRSLLCPRRSGSHDTSALDRLYVPVSSMRPPAPSGHQPSSAAVLNRIYYIAAADIEKMQMEATADDRYNIGGRRKRSKLEAFSAYLWRLVAAAVAKKQKKHDMRVCRMGIVVNGRYRMKPPELLANYFGNVLSIPYGTLGVQDLQMMALSEVTDQVHRFMQDATREEHFLGLIDWVEARRPEPAVARIYCNGRTTSAAEGEAEEEEGIAFVVSSGRGFPVAELDFGWGRPVFGSYHFPWGDSAGYVMPMPSARANGDWVVYMHLLDDVIEAVESDDIFCPLTPDYLDLLDHHHHL